MEWVVFVQLGLPLLLLAVGLTSGSIVESRHYQSIEKREQWSRRIAVVTAEHLYDDAQVRKVKMVQGNAVISLDYFKRFLAWLRGIVGGRVSAYETLVDRARREATLRMKEEARGATIIVNARIETSNVGARDSNDGGGIGSVEALAYGTAIWYER